MTLNFLCLVPDWTQTLVHTFDEDAFVFESPPYSIAFVLSKQSSKPASILEPLFYTCSKSPLRHTGSKPDPEAQASDPSGDRRVETSRPDWATEEFKASLSNLIEPCLKVKTTQRSGDVAQGIH